LAMVAVFGLLAIPTVASAHAGNDDPNVVHACIAKASQAVRVVGVSGSCIASPVSKAETPAHWAIQGPQGPRGANGTNGTNSTNGTNGIDGTSVTVFGTFSGDQNGCPNGGTISVTANGNAYVCNGQDATGATNPNPPCFDNGKRYIDCGNGTVTDTVTGLVWLQQANCLPIDDWSNASQATAMLKDGECNLTDKSVPGDWRLPTADEWSATVARAVALGCGTPTAPSLTDDAGTTCYDAAGRTSFVGVFASTPVDPNMIYWSSNANELSPTKALVMFLNGGFSGGSVLKHLLHAGAWPVRSGHR